MKNSNKDRASRGVLRGIGNNTVQGPAGAKGGTEVVHTFGWYLRQMVKDVQAKRAIPLLSGMVPTNSFNGGKFRDNWPMASDTAAVAKQEGVEYIDHTKYTAARFQSLGAAAVKRYFPRDSTHTNSAGARGAQRTAYQTPANMSSERGNVRDSAEVCQVESSNVYWQQRAGFDTAVLDL